MILYNNIVKISKNRLIGYMLKVAFLLASSIFSDSVATGTASTTVVSSPGQGQSEAPQSPSFSLGPVPSSPVTSPGSIFDETVSQATHLH